MIGINFKLFYNVFLSISVVCDYWQLKCESDGICVDNRRRCDGENDCYDGTDEQGCTTDDLTEGKKLAMHGLRW